MNVPTNVGGRAIRSRIVHGLLAGAAGTAALNLATYADIAIRARPPSPVPEQDVEALARRASIPLGDDEAAARRRSGIGSLMGYLTGMSAGIAWAAVEPLMRRIPQPVAAAALGIAVMAATDASSAKLGTTDPRRWTAADWAADVVPHLLYGTATVAAYDAMRDSSNAVGR